MAGRLLFRGPIDLGEGPVSVDLWSAGSAVVAFEGGTERGRLTGLGLALGGPAGDRRLEVYGLNPEGQPALWVGADPARLIGHWYGAKVAWPDGEGWNQAEVTWTQYGVRATTLGMTPRELPAARTEVVGDQRWIVDSTGEYIPASSGKGCGCGG